MSNLDYQLFYRRHLPHYQPPGATVFVTFRLANSLPVTVIRRLMEEAARIDHELEKITDHTIRDQRAYVEHKRMFSKWDAALDCGRYGPQWLRERQVAQLVAEGLHYRDGQIYALDGYTIMSNHVHVVFTPLKKSEAEYHALSAIMQSLKRHTAQAANALLQRTGEVWHHENYDHIVRDDAEYRRILQYVLSNPVKAGLAPTSEDWEWNYSKFGKAL
jgi:REP element-mobilizing transposase RayT